MQTFLIGLASCLVGFSTYAEGSWRVAFAAAATYSVLTIIKS